MCPCLKESGVDSKATEEIRGARGLQVSVVLSLVGLQSGGSTEKRMETAWMDKGNTGP